MLTKFVLITFIKQDVRKIVNSNTSSYGNDTITKLQHHNKT